MEERDDQRTTADGPPSPVDDLVDERAELIGADVGGYVIDGELGRGGCGVVFSATHPVIGKRAAIKVLKRSLSQNPATVERFVQEARSVNQIGHPNIVDIFAFGALPDGRSYLVMDLLEGESLRKRVRRGALTISETIHVLDEVASALAAAHDKGFIHRDLKPDNVFLVTHGGRTECKLLDFGLAKLAPNAMHARAYRTATGAQLGTPDYMSPEQLRGAESVDARTDIYALGVLAFEILVGARPRRYTDGSYELDGNTIAEAIIEKTRAPDELARLVEAMLSIDADQRPSLSAIRAVLKRARSAVPRTSVIGVEVNLPPVRASGTAPATESTSASVVPTLDESRRPAMVPQPGGMAAALGAPLSGTPAAATRTPVPAGLRAPGAPVPATKIGVAPPPEKPSRPHPVASQSMTRPPARAARVWLLVGIFLVLAGGLGLVFVLAQ